MKLFKSEDFQIITPGFEHLIIDTKAAADFANQAFNKWLKSQPDVFVSRGYGHSDTWRENIGDLDSVPSHRAKLVCIERIE